MELRRRLHPLINSGGESKGASDLADAVRTAVINTHPRRAPHLRPKGQRPMKDGAALLNAAQDVYLDDSITVA